MSKPVTKGGKGTSRRNIEEVVQRSVTEWLAQNADSAAWFAELPDGNKAQILTKFLTANDAEESLQKRAATLESSLEKLPDVDDLTERVKFLLDTIRTLTGERMMVGMVVSRIGEKCPTAQEIVELCDDAYRAGFLDGQEVAVGSRKRYSVSDMATAAKRLAETGGDFGVITKLGLVRRFLGMPDLTAKEKEEAWGEQQAGYRAEGRFGESTPDQARAGSASPGSDGSTTGGQHADR